MKIEKKELFIGDYVRWQSSGGLAYGRIVRRTTDGSIQVPQTDFEIVGDEENPAYLIRLYEQDEEGEWEETDTYVGHRESALSRIPSLEDDEEEDDEEEEGDEDESYDDDEMPEDESYDEDKTIFEQMNLDELNSFIGKGDYVRFEVSGTTYRGRVIDVTKDGCLQSTIGFKLEGEENDPAVLIRLYRENEDGTYEEGDIKVVHRMSSLIKIGKICNNIKKVNFASNNNSKKSSNVKEVKSFSFNITETKEIDVDGIKYGIVRGYASTYGNVDRGNDKVLPGAFTKSIDEYIQKKRPIKMYFNHDSNEIIGGFPVDKMKDDQNGLYVEGQINLDVQKGRECYALAKQGVMQDFSIGYTVNDYDIKNGVRELKQLDLWEISMVGEPMNTEARILSVKNAVPYQDLPLADESREWDSTAAVKRIRQFTDSEDAPSSKYKQAFMWFDSENPDVYGSYKLPYADVINGRLYAIPRAIYAIAAILNGGQGGVDIPEADKERVVSNINRYYAKLGKESPLEKSKTKKALQYEDVVKIKDKRDLERILRDSGVFSRKAATYLSSIVLIKQSDSVGNKIELEEVKHLLNYLNNRG